MNKQYDNTNSGALFKNDRKEKEKQPDYQGSINIDGRDYWLSAWLKDGQRGKFMSLAVKPKEEQEAKQPSRALSRAPAPPPSRGGSGFDEMADDIPF